MERTDDELIGAYREGDEAALAALIERYLEPIYRFASRLAGKGEADDIVQDTFVKLWRTIGRYKTTGTFKAWVFAIARNTAIDRLRKKKAAVFSDFEDATGRNPMIESLSDPDMLPATLIEKAEREGLVEKILADLTPGDREILHLHYAEDMTFEAIGKVTGKPLNTVKSRHRRALAKLREKLEAEPE